MPEGRGFELRLPTFPVLQLALLALTAWMSLIGGTITFGTWGDLDVRLAGAYVIPALALHAWSSLRPRMWPRALAWGLVFAMCVHSQVLLQPVLLATLGLLAILDLGLHSARVPRSQASPAARAVAGLTVLAAVGILFVLYQVATFDALTRLGATTVLGAALVVACALYPAMRAPQRLLPALGVYYLAFVLMAAPILPFGPAIAWWFLCASVFLGAVVAARHVSGHELPPAQRRHEHVVSHLPDPFLAAEADAIERFLASGAGARDLSRRVEAALGRDDGGKLLPDHVKDIGGPRAGREHREYALRRILESSP